MKELFILFIIGFSATSLIAQQVPQKDSLEVPINKNICEANIRTAQEYYKLGDFQKVIYNIESCVNGKKLDGEKYEEALVLLSKNYIALDQYGTAKIYITELINENPNFQTRSDDPMQFQLMVEDTKLGDNGLQVSSVSKVAESLFEAPASVLLITADMIKRRGYMDLEQLLHDLQGFDVSRSNGILYSHVYQRGYRMINTNRILFLVDGVEENDLWGNIVYLSRQYPISSIKSVEVVYGPASTIYGPNAFLGVISVITKNPREITGTNKDFGIAAEVGYGQNNTRYADVTIAADFPKKEVDLSLTMRYFRSDEFDFSDVDSWQDYEPWNLDDKYNPEISLPFIEDLYRKFLIIGDSAAASTFAQQYVNHSNNNYFTYQNDSIFPTAEGLQQALFVDNQTLRDEYHDYTETFLMAGKIRFNNLVIGFQTWYKIEGLGTWYSDVQRTAEQYWSPKSTFAYIKYDKQINSKIAFSSFARYKLHGYHPQTYLTKINAYKNGKLDIENLLIGGEPTIDTTYFSTISNQVRIENRLYYTPSKYFTVVTGMENRLSSIQDNYASSAQPYPLETEGGAGVNHYFSQDFGLFSQATYKFGGILPALDGLNLAAGIRWDNNRIWDRGGYQDNYSPRLVGVYSKKRFVFKAIYAEAYKTPTNFDLYSTVAGSRDTSNADLKPEYVTNMELSVRYFLDKKKLSSIELLAYNANYRNALETRKVEFGDAGTQTSQFSSVGLRNIKGIEVNADYRSNTNFGQFYFWGNYSYTLPIDDSDIITNSAGDTIYVRNEDGTITSADGQYVDSVNTTISIGDISAHKFNIGFNYRYKGLNVNLRVNYLGPKGVGPYTNVFDNPLWQEFDNDHFKWHTAISYNFPEQGLTIQGVMNNIFNKQISAPGLRTADIENFAARLPQNGREIHLKLKFDMGVNLRSKNRNEIIK
jgi:outer membrane receptor protein involved in Fe transport